MKKGEEGRKKYKTRPINGGKKYFVSRDTHASFSFFLPLLLLSLFLSFEGSSPSMNYRWRSRPSYARSEAIRYRVRACLRACVHNIRMWHLFSPGSRATRGRSKIDLVPSLKGIERQRGGLRSTIGCRTTRPDPLRSTRKSGGKIAGEDLSERRRVKKGVDRVGGRKPSIFLFLFVFFLGERASDFSSFLFPWVCFRRCVTSRIFIARIRRKIDGLLTACND